MAAPMVEGGLRESENKDNIIPITAGPWSYSCTSTWHARLGTSAASEISHMGAAGATASWPDPEPYSCTAVPWYEHAIALCSLSEALCRAVERLSSTLRLGPCTFVVPSTVMRRGSALMNLW